MSVKLIDSSSSAFADRSSECTMLEIWYHWTTRTSCCCLSFSNVAASRGPEKLGSRIHLRRLPPPRSIRTNELSRSPCAQRHRHNIGLYVSVLHGVALFFLLHLTQQTACACRSKFAQGFACCFSNAEEYSATSRTTLGSVINEACYSHPHHHHLPLLSSGLACLDLSARSSDVLHYNTHCPRSCVLLITN